MRCWRLSYLQRLCYKIHGGFAASQTPLRVSLPIKFEASLTWPSRGPLCPLLQTPAALTWRLWTAPLMAFFHRCSSAMLSISTKTLLCFMLPFYITSSPCTPHRPFLIRFVSAYLTLPYLTFPCICLVAKRLLFSGH